MAFNATAWLPALTLFMLLAYWIYDGKLFAKLGFTSKEVLAIFAIKCSWCLLNAWLHWTFQRGGDTYDFFQIGAQVHRALYRDPRDFFALVFLPNDWYVTDGLHHYFRSVATYGNEDSFLLVRLNALFYLVSFGSYPAHLILFSFVTLPGLLLLLRFAYNHVNLHKRWVNGWLLLFPGVAMWCNAMHKESLALSGIGFLLFAITSIKFKGITWSNIALVGIGWVHFIARWYLPILLLPVFFAVYLYHQRFSKKLLVTTAMLGLLSAVLLLLTILRSDLHQRINDKLMAFNRTAGNALSATSISEIFRSVPSGLYNGFLSPLPLGNPIGAQSIFFFLLNGVSLLLPLALITRLNRYRFIKLGIWLVGVAFVGITALGMAVSNVGALQRYKAPLLVVWIMGWLMSISGKRFIIVKM